MTGLGLTGTQGEVKLQLWVAGMKHGDHLALISIA